MCVAPVYRWMRPILDLMCHHDACLALELFANDGFEDIMPNMCVQGRQDIVHKNHLRAPVEFVVGGWEKGWQTSYFFRSGKKTVPLLKKQINNESSHIFKLPEQNSDIPKSCAKFTCAPLYTARAKETRCF